MNKDVETLPFIDERNVHPRPAHEIIAVRAAVGMFTQKLLDTATEHNAEPGWDNQLPAHVKDPFDLEKERARFIGQVEGVNTALGIENDSLLSDLEHNLGTNPLDQPENLIYTQTSEPRTKDELLGTIRTLKSKHLISLRMSGARAAPTTTREWDSAQHHPTLLHRATDTLRLVRNAGRDDGLGFALGQFSIDELYERSKYAASRRRIPKPRPPTG